MSYRARYASNDTNYTSSVSGYRSQPASNRSSLYLASDYNASNYSNLTDFDRQFKNLMARTEKFTNRVERLQTTSTHIKKGFGKLDRTVTGLRTQRDYIESSFDTIDRRLNYGELTTEEEWKKYLDAGILIEKAVELMRHYNRVPKPTFEYSPPERSPYAFDISSNTSLVSAPSSPTDKKALKLKATASTTKKWKNNADISKRLDGLPEMEEEPVELEKVKLRPRKNNELAKMRNNIEIKANDENNVKSLNGETSFVSSNIFKIENEKGQNGINLNNDESNTKNGVIRRKKSLFQTLNDNRNVRPKSLYELSSDRSSAVMSPKTTTDQSRNSLVSNSVNSSTTSTLNRTSQFLENGRTPDNLCSRKVESSSFHEYNPGTRIPLRERLAMRQKEKEIEEEEKRKKDDSKKSRSFTQRASKAIASKTTSDENHGLSFKSRFFRKFRNAEKPETSIVQEEKPRRRATRRRSDSPKEILEQVSNTHDENKSDKKDALGDSQYHNKSLESIGSNRLPFQSSVDSLASIQTNGSDDVFRHDIRINKILSETINKQENLHSYNIKNEHENSHFNTEETTFTPTSSIRKQSFKRNLFENKVSYNENKTLTGADLPNGNSDTKSTVKENSVIANEKIISYINEDEISPMEKRTNKLNLAFISPQTSTEEIEEEELLINQIVDKAINDNPFDCLESLLPPVCNEDSVFNAKILRKRYSLHLDRLSNISPSHDSEETFSENKTEPFKLDKKCEKISLSPSSFLPVNVKETSLFQPLTPKETNLVSLDNIICKNLKNENDDEFTDLHSKSLDSTLTEFDKINDEMHQSLLDLTNSKNKQRRDEKDIISTMEKEIKRSKSVHELSKYLPSNINHCISLSKPDLSSIKTTQNSSKNDLRSSWNDSETFKQSIKSGFEDKRFNSLLECVDRDMNELQGKKNSEQNEIKSKSCLSLLSHSKTRDESSEHTITPLLTSSMSTDSIFESKAIQTKYNDEKVENISENNFENGFSSQNIEFNSNNLLLSKNKRYYDNNGLDPNLNKISGYNGDLNITDMESVSSINICGIKTISSINSECRSESEELKKFVAMNEKKEITITKLTESFKPFSLQLNQIRGNPKSELTNESLEKISDDFKSLGKDIDEAEDASKLVKISSFSTQSLENSLEIKPIVPVSVGTLHHFTTMPTDLLKLKPLKVLNVKDPPSVELPFNKQNNDRPKSAEPSRRLSYREKRETHMKLLKSTEDLNQNMPSLMEIGNDSNVIVESEESKKEQVHSTEVRSESIENKIETIDISEEHIPKPQFFNDIINKENLKKDENQKNYKHDFIQNDANDSHSKSNEHSTSCDSHLTFCENNSTFYKHEISNEKADTILNSNLENLGMSSDLVKEDTRDSKMVNNTHKSCDMGPVKVEVFNSDKINIGDIEFAARQSSCEYYSSADDNLPGVNDNITAVVSDREIMFPLVIREISRSSSVENNLKNGSTTMQGINDDESSSYIGLKMQNKDNIHRVLDNFKLTVENADKICQKMRNNSRKSLSSSSDSSRSVTPSECKIAETKPVLSKQLSLRDYRRMKLDRHRTASESSAISDDSSFTTKSEVDKSPQADISDFSEDFNKKRNKRYSHSRKDILRLGSSSSGSDTTYASSSNISPRCGALSRNATTSRNSAFSKTKGKSLDISSEPVVLTSLARNNSNLDDRRYFSDTRYNKSKKQKLQKRVETM